MDLSALQQLLSAVAGARVTDDEEPLLRAVCDALGSPLPMLDSAAA